MQTKLEFVSLPTEIITAIYEEMEGIDVVRARQTCKKMHVISTERSIWTGLLARENYRLRLDEPVDKYSTPELQKHVLRQICTELAWRSSRQPVVRCASDNLDPEIGNRGITLLEGGRWLLTFGRHLSHPSGGPNNIDVCAYDLDSSTMPVYDVYQLEPEDTFNLEYVVAQVDPRNVDFAFNIAIVSETSWGLRIKVVQMNQQGRGLDAKPVFSALFPSVAIVGATIESRPCLQGDLIVLKYLDSIEIINWRTATVFTYEATWFQIDFGAETDHLRLLPGNKVLAIQLDGVAVYEFHNLRRQRSDNPINECESLQLLWKMQIDSFPILEERYINLSDPCHIGSAVRLSLRIDDSVYGIIIPDSGICPTLYLLGTSADLMHVHRDAIDLGLTKMCIASRSNSGDQCNTSTLAFSWPDNTLEMAGRQPPSLSCLHRTFKLYKFGMDRGCSVFDDASGRIVTTVWSRYPSRHSLPGHSADISPWSIIDFCAPQYLPGTTEET